MNSQHRQTIQNGFDTQVQGKFNFKSTTSDNMDIDREKPDELQYKEGGIDEFELNQVEVTDLSLSRLVESWKEYHEGKGDDVFFTHFDHLGSASWITNMHGEPIQYMHYAPYGELMANIKNRNLEFIKPL